MTTQRRKDRLAALTIASARTRRLDTITARARGWYLSEAIARLGEPSAGPWWVVVVINPPWIGWHQWRPFVGQA